MSMKYFYLLSLFLAVVACTDKVGVKVTNMSTCALKGESIVVSWHEIENRLKKVTPGNVVVCNAEGAQIPSQVLFEGGDAPTGILFQADVLPQAEARYVIQTGLREAYDTLAYGRFVPERKDDFAWENDKIAYRMYGPALEADGEISNGIDIWLKRTSGLVINKWYTKGYNYHADSGEGLDCYKVGRTLGGGANTPVIGDSLVMSNNFVSYRVLDNGPLRISFELLYAPFRVDSVEVTQKRVVTLDAGNPMNTITTTYTGNFDQLDIATGIVILDQPGEKSEFSSNAIAYAQPEDPANGITYALVVTRDAGNSKQVGNHLLKFARVKNGGEYIYRSGGYWSKYGVDNYDAWLRIIQDESVRFNNFPFITLE